MLRRIHSDGEVAYARVAAIKACLVRNTRLRGDPLEVSVMLDRNNADPAYCCGRAFALLEVPDRARKEKIQTDSADGSKDYKARPPLKIVISLPLAQHRRLFSRACSG